MSAKPAELEFTGERFVPGAPGEIVYEHLHRYAFARRFAAGRRVLDAACGEGYGSALLAQVAAEVTGVDLDPATIEHARTTYAGTRTLHFVEGSVTALPLAAASVDLVVSFETIEHLAAADQPVMLAEFARVLAPEGLLVISSPNRPEYSERRDYHNPFHVHELDRGELELLLDRHFPARRWFRQRVWLGSMLRAESPVDGAELWTGEAKAVAPADPHEAMYFLVLAATADAALPPTMPSLSLFSDQAETELTRCAAHAKDAIRLDGIAVEHLAQLDRQTLHIQHLERLVAERDAALARRDAELGRRDEELRRRDARNADGYAQAQRALDAQERLIEQRQSLRWWLALPWFRARLAWMRWRRP